MYVAIFGMFSVVWFGWAQENPKKSWRKYIGIATGFSLLLCLIGVYLSIMNWNAATSLTTKGRFTSYLIVVYLEFLLAGLGAFFLMRRKRTDYIAPWIAFIVGTHFFWLVNIFKDPSLYILALLMIAIAILSPWLAKKLGVASSAITGIGSGTALFCFGILGLIRYLLV